MAKGKIGTRHDFGGRPTKYDEKVILKLTREYIDSCGESYERVLQTKKTYTNKLRVNVPMIEGLALKLKVHKDTIAEWRKIHEPFSVLIDEMLNLQAVMIANGSIIGDYVAPIAKAFLARHGYRDSTELVGAGGSNLFRPDEKDKEDADRALGAI